MSAVGTGRLSSPRLPDRIAYSGTPARISAAFTAAVRAMESRRFIP